MTETAVETSSAEAVSSLPTGEPVIADVPPVFPKKAPIGAVLAAAPSNFDAFISHLHRCMRTRGGTDLVLLFITYSLRLTGAVLDGLSRTALRHSARKLVALLYQLPPSSTVVLSGAPAPPLAALALRFNVRLQALIAMLGEWRTMNRLWGLMGMYFTAKELLARKRAEKAEGKPSDKFNTAVEAGQIAALTAYHLFEATVWLSTKKVLAWSPKAQARMSAWSVKSWAAYVAMEITRMLVDRARKNKSVDEKAEVDVKWYENWNKEFLRTAAWAPLTVHWSLPGGLLPEIVVAFLAVYPSTGLMRDLWRSTAETA
ncbi:Fc.00g007050.m01.CDS01 [Cosmosporella sp. VM-42]